MEHPSKIKNEIVEENENSGQFAQTKKRKVKDESTQDNQATSSSSKQHKVLINSEGESYFKLSESKRLTVRKWKSQVLIDIREFYQDKAGEWRPGKKGISLSLEQYKALKDCMMVVDDSSGGTDGGLKVSLVDQMIQKLQG